jgi:adenylate cyclase
VTAPDSKPPPADLERENRLLARRLARMEENVRTMEEMQDSNSRILASLMRELDQERAKSRDLLLSILPQRVIDRLGSGETVIADRFESLTVLFSDFVAFTSISSELPPAVLVQELSRIFSAFDAICAETKVEKIKTIGDAYMAVGGLPGTDPDHASAIAEAALRMRSYIDEQDDSPARWQIRIGIHTGPAVAGVIGTRKFIYDVWGDTVNVASRLQGASEPGGIQLSKEAAERLEGKYQLEFRGNVELKGKGPVPAYLLVGRVADAR